VIAESQRVDRCALIPRVSVDTSLMPPEEQFARWAKFSTNARLTPLVSGSFLAKGTLWNLGSAVVTTVRLDPLVTERDQALVNTTDAEFLQIITLLEGRLKLETPGAEQACAAPDVVVRDYRYPSRATTTRIHCTTVYLARAFLEEATGPIAFQGRLASSPELDIYRDTLRVISRHLPMASAASAGFYARTLRDMAAAALLNQAELTRNEEKGALFGAAKRYIAAQPPGTLSIAAMTASLGVSRSVLFRLFRHSGGVLAYDRMRRLRALYRDLCNPAERRSIGDLGTSHGFTDPASLARLSRATFGCSLSELRRRSRTAPMDRPASPIAGVRDAIEQLA